MSQFPGAENPLGYATNHPAIIPPLSGRARAARITLIITLCTMFLLMGALFLIIPAQEFRNNPVPADAVKMIVLGLSMVVGGCSEVIAYILSVIFFCLWIYRASQIAHLCAGNMKYSAGWAVGWFFIPFANLVMPYRVMSELWQVSIDSQDPTSHWESNPVSATVGAWWLLYVFGGIIGRIGGIMQRVPSLLLPSLVVQAFGILVVIASGILCLRIIRQLSENLELRRQQLLATRIGSEN